MTTSNMNRNDELTTKIDSGLIDRDEEVTAIKGSKFCNITIETEDTTHIAESQLNIKRSFRFPVDANFLDSGFVLPPQNNKLKIRLLKYAIRTRLISPMDIQKTNALPNLSAALSLATPPALKSNFEASLISALHFVLVYFLDEYLEKAFEDPANSGLNEKIFLKFLDIFVGILDNQPLESSMNTLESFIEGPKMLNIFKSLLKLAEILQNLLVLNVSNYADAKKRKAYTDSVRMVLLPYVWYHTYPLKKEKHQLSNAAMCFLKRYSFGARSGIEIWALSVNINLDDNIRCDPMFCLIIEAAESIGFLVNDIFSFSKEISDDSLDNIILYKCHIGWTTEKAFDFALDKLREEYKDYSMYSRKLRQIHSSNDDLQKFIDIVDYSVAIFIPMHAKMQRYNKTKCFIDGTLLN